MMAMSGSKAEAVAEVAAILEELRGMADELAAERPGFDRRRWLGTLLLMDEMVAGAVRDDDGLH